MREEREAHWDKLSMMDRFRLSLEFPGMYTTPFMTPLGYLKTGKSCVVHGKYLA